MPNRSIFIARFGKGDDPRSGLENGEENRNRIATPDIFIHRGEKKINTGKWN